MSDPKAMLQNQIMNGYFLYLSHYKKPSYSFMWSTFKLMNGAAEMSKNSSKVCEILEIRQGFRQQEKGNTYG